MSDDPEKKDDPAAELKQGLTHLWRAARGVAAGVKKEVDRTDIGKAVEGAGREFVRAAANVVDRIAEEVDQLARPVVRPGEGDAPPPPPVESNEDRDEDRDEDDDFDGVRPREKAPEDTGVRIAVDDDSDKKKSE